MENNTLVEEVEFHFADFCFVFRDTYSETCQASKMENFDRFLNMPLIQDISIGNCSFLVAVALAERQSRSN